MFAKLELTEDKKNLLKILSILMKILMKLKNYFLPLK